MYRFNEIQVADRQSAGIPLFQVLDVPSKGIPFMIAAAVSC